MEEEKEAISYRHLIVFLIEAFMLLRSMLSFKLNLLFLTSGTLARAGGRKDTLIF